MIHGVLYVLGKGTGHSSYIHFVCIQSLRLDKYLMAVFIRESHHLVFNRRAVPGSCSLDHPGIKGRSVKITADDLVSLFVGIGKPAGFLPDLYRFRICGKRKGNDPFVSELFFHFRVIDGISRDPGRGSRFEAENLNSKFFQGICEIIGRFQSVGTCGVAHVSVDTPCLQICSRTEYHRSAPVYGAGIQLHSFYISFFRKKPGHFSFPYGEMLLIFQSFSHLCAVGLLVRLGS